MRDGFWAGRKVLVTGHSGFKGGWLSLWLSDLGAEVTGYALAPPTSPSLFAAAGLEAGMAPIEGDVRDRGALSACFADAAPEIVFHLAAQPLVRASYADPVETFETNVLGTLNVLEAARQAPGVRVIVNVTSDKCYENREWPWGYRENDRLGGKDPYSSSKACAELVTAAYRESFFSPKTGTNPGIAVASARAGNVIGGGDWGEDRLVPDMVKALAAGDTPLIRNPAAVRPWQHVLEPLQGYLALAEALWEQGHDLASGWNFGPDTGEARAVHWLADRVCAGWDNGAAWRTEPQHDAPPEARVLKLECSKAISQLGWRPRLTLAEAVRWTVDWYQAFYAGHDVHRETLDQIRRYTGLPESDD